jgi:hypothetical protein
MIEFKRDAFLILQMLSGEVLEFAGEVCSLLYSWEAGLTAGGKIKSGNFQDHVYDIHDFSSLPCNFISWKYGMDLEE